MRCQIQGAAAQDIEPMPAAKQARSKPAAAQKEIPLGNQPRTFNRARSTANVHRAAGNRQVLTDRLAAVDRPTGPQAREVFQLWGQS